MARCRARSWPCHTAPLPTILRCHGAQAPVLPPTGRVNAALDAEGNRGENFESIFVLGVERLALIGPCATASDNRAHVLSICRAILAALPASLPDNRDGCLHTKCPPRAHRAGCRSGPRGAVRLILNKAGAHALVSLQKPGKWCAAHVRIAWEIHLHQQKQQAESRSSSSSIPSTSSSADGLKSSDALRPPSHLFPPSSSNPLLRPGSDLISSTSLLGECSHAPPHCLYSMSFSTFPAGAHGRSPYEPGGPHPFLTHGALGKPRGECLTRCTALSHVFFLVFLLFSSLYLFHSVPCCLCIFPSAPYRDTSPSFKELSFSPLAQHVLLSPSIAGIPPFPRPSPYANLAGLGSNAFGGLGTSKQSHFK